jgi:hypothetical protein
MDVDLLTFYIWAQDYLPRRQRTRVTGLSTADFIFALLEFVAKGRGPTMLPLPFPERDRQGHDEHGNAVIVASPLACGHCPSEHRLHRTKSCPS